MVNFLSKKNKEWKEHYIKYSPFSCDKKYYIIRRNDIAGLFSLVNTTLGHIKYALDKGYIPVVDMMNYENAYLSKKNLHKVNAWEYFFEQPCNISVLEAMNSKNVILSRGMPLNIRPDDTMSYFNNVNGELDEWKRIAKQYLRIQKNILDEIEEEFCQLCTEQDRVLGVKIRGTDYVKYKPQNHPVQPDIETVICDTKSMMEQYECNKIFLGTEDKSYEKLFKKEFGKAVVTNCSEKIDYKEGNTATVRIQRKDDEYLQGKEYLTTLVMLSKCNCFLASRTSGTVGVMYMNENFEATHIYDLGKYK